MPNLLATQDTNFDEYRVNVSAIQDYMRCPFRWWAKWVMNYVPKYDALPLSFGKLLHQIFEDYHTGGGEMAEIINRYKVKWTQMLAEATEPQSVALGTKVLKQLDDLTEALVLWRDTYQFEIPVLEVEEPFTINLGNGIIGLGRPDRVGISHGSLWHVQNKGLAASTHFGVYISLAKRSYHEHLYLEHLRTKYPDYPIGGTMWNLVRKLKYRTGVTKSKPLGETKDYAEMFLQHPMAVDLEGGLHKHVIECIVDHAVNMRESHRRWVKNGIIPSPNENMNGGMFGNAPDEYFSVLIGDYELGDPRYFKVREDMYAATEGDES